MFPKMLPKLVNPWERFCSAIAPINGAQHADLTIMYGGLVALYVIISREGRLATAMRARKPWLSCFPVPNKELVASTKTIIHSKAPF